MPEFEKNQLNYFEAEQGAYSPVTVREATGDKSVTIDRDEKSVLVECYPLDTFKQMGGGADDGKLSHHLFNVFDSQAKTYAPIELAVTYPKLGKSELRLYFSRGTDFYPIKDTTWFIFTRAGEVYPFIGYMNNGLWNAVSKQSTGNTSAVKLLDEDDHVFQTAVYSPKARQGSSKVTVTQYSRDARLAINVIKKAGYQCEYDNQHTSFVSASTGQQYVEAHHLVPVACADQFPVSLDVPTNIVALCPNCHRAVHHADAATKREFIEQLFKARKHGLEAQGIEITQTQLLAIYGVE